MLPSSTLLAADILSRAQFSICCRDRRALEYARDALSDGVGFVTAFEIPEAYFIKFQVQTVGLDHHQELWVPAEQLDEFNDMIVNGIRVEKAFVGGKYNLTDKIAKVLPGSS